MKLYEKIKFIKEYLEEEIVIIRAGNFFIAVDKDALFLSELLGLKCTCFAKETCKVGFPTNSLDKYYFKLLEAGYSFVIYDVNAIGEVEILRKNITTKKYDKKKYKVDCIQCKKNKSESIDRNKKEKENLNSIISQVKKYKEKIKNETGE